MNWWTELRYWWIDSIVKQSIMLMDKSGLRGKEKGKAAPGAYSADKFIKSPTQEQFTTAWEKMVGKKTS